MHRLLSARCQLAVRACAGRDAELASRGPVAGRGAHRSHPVMPLCCRVPACETADLVVGQTNDSISPHTHTHTGTHTCSPSLRLYPYRFLLQVLYHLPQAEQPRGAAPRLPTPCCFFPWLCQFPGVPSCQGVNPGPMPPCAACPWCSLPRTARPVGAGRCACTQLCKQHPRGFCLC